MAPPKKKETQKMSLGDFQKYGGGTSWADEVEDTYAMASHPLPPPERPSGYGTSSYGQRSYDSGYARESVPQKIPDKPPYTAHLGNLTYDATVESVTDFFAGCKVVSVRIIEDRIEQRPKGFAYVEFETAEGLKQALTLDGKTFGGRTIRIKVAEPPKDRDGRTESTRDLSDWSRKGPLADLPPRGGIGMERRPSEFGERRGSREATGDGKTRDFDNWERKGPLSPLPQPERQGPGSRDGSRPRTTDAGRTDSFRKDRRQSPASWGEGRQDGSRPPRREFPDRERPERAERVPSAAERDMQWRSSMRPDPVPPAGKSPIPSRDGSEAPPSPAGGPSPAPAPAGRPKLQLQKRTVSDSPDITSPAPPSSDAKPSPFGAARPIDTAAREREVEEKRLQAAREKKEAEERAKEERRLAREAAAREAAAKEAAEKEAADAKAAAAAAAPAGSAAPAEEKPAEGSATAEATKPEEATTKEKEAQNGAGPDQKLPVRTREPREPKEHVQNYKSRAAESGNWRSSSAEHTPREEYRGGRSEGRGEGRGGGRGVPSGPRRGSGPPRGPREGGGRGGYRANGGPPPAVQQPNPPQSKGDDAETVSTPTQDEDGWTTVPAKQKGRGQGTRPVTTA